MKTTGRRKSANIINMAHPADPFLAAAKVFNQGNQIPTPRPPLPQIKDAIDKMMKKQGLPKTTKKQDRLQKRWEEPANVWRVSD